MVSHSEDQTRELGRALAAVLRPGDVVGLQGPLGAGKTVLVRGLAEGMGLAAEAVRSPTFTLINEYREGEVRLYHIDLYRLELVDLDWLALAEVLESGAVSVVEWCERTGRDVYSLVVRFDMVDAESRRLEFSARESRLVDWLGTLRAVSEGGESWL